MKKTNCGINLNLFIGTPVNKINTIHKIFLRAKAI